MSGIRWVLAGSLAVLGCAEAPVTSSGPKPDAGQPVATAVTHAGPVQTAPNLTHFDPGVVNRAIDPCVDFHQYACSSWLAANPIPADQPVWGTLSDLRIWNQTVVRETMEKASLPDARRSQLEQQIGDYWAACMDVQRIDQEGVAPLLPDLKRLNALKSKRGIAREIALLHSSVPGSTAGRTGADNHTPAALFGFGAMQDLADASLVVANLDQGGMGLPGCDYYLSEDPKTREIRQKYEAHVRRMLELSGEPSRRSTSDAAAVLRIETALAKVAMDVVRRRDPKNINNVRTRAQIESTVPSFDWKAYFTGISAPEPKHIVVSTPGFLAGLEQVLRREPLGAWKAYLRWWTLHGNASLIGRPFDEEDFDFYGRTIAGTERLPPRWRRCVTWADRDLGEAVGRAYVDRAFSPQRKQQAQELVDAVEEALARSIAENDWMSAATKKEANDKLRAIEDKIGYPSVWRDYSSLAIGRDSMVRNAHAAAAFELQRQLKKIGRPVDRTEWLQTPPTVDAYYHPQLNTINFPAGILQPPLFEERMGEASFGGIGTIIGHEVVHGFDDLGRKFDARGDLRDWWTPEDAQRYQERGKCIADEYTQEIPELGVKQNGRLTQGEDTADNGGLRLAYSAMAAALAAKGGSIDAKGPDGLTHAQRFFLAHAFAWCAAFRPEIARVQVATNPHSLPKYRVNNVVANMPEFQRAFGCRAGQPMVRVNVCRIW